MSKPLDARAPSGPVGKIDIADSGGPIWHPSSANQKRATELAAAWKKYVELFGEPPHGTERQMGALIVLTGWED